MKLLGTAAEIGRELTRLLDECDSCQVAVAWAGIGFDGFLLLVKYQQKIARMVVGTHFFQTHPDFIQTFLDHACTRFVLQKGNKEPLFHPKIYLFDLPGGSWTAIVGSPNFTVGGLAKNDEAAVLITHEDRDAEVFRDELTKSLESYWKQAAALSPSQLDTYRETWQRKQAALMEVQDPVPNDSILTCSWDQYYAMLEKNSRAVPRHYSIEGRLLVIQAARELFASHARFSDFSVNERQRVAGTLYYKKGTIDGINYLWFGSMFGNGMFKSAVNRNDPQLAEALDAIPLQGEITKGDYLAYVERFIKAFPHGRDGIPAASRLLAMKRPDTFLCLDGQNERKLCEAFGLRHQLNHKHYEKYWDLIIAPLLASPWWRSPPPDAPMEGQVWQARAAFLDCLYYEGVASDEE